MLNADAANSSPVAATPNHRSLTTQVIRRAAHQATRTARSGTGKRSRGRCSGPFTGIAITLWGAVSRLRGSQSRASPSMDASRGCKADCWPDQPQVVVPHLGDSGAAWSDPRDGLRYTHPEAASWSALAWEPAHPPERAMRRRA